MGIVEIDMSTSGLNQTYQPNTLDGLNVLEADQIYIDGQLVNLSDYVPYQSATKTIDLNSQIIKTSHTATINNELVNKGLLDTSISNLAISIAGSFLDKVTTTPQTVIGNVSYTAQLSSDNLIVPETKEADLGGVVQVSGNYRRSENDAGVTATSSFGSITSSMGVFQATTTANFATLQLATVTVGKRYKVNINVLGDIALYTSSLQLYASVDGVNPTQSLGASAGFLPSSTIFQLITDTFVPQYQYIILLCINSSPTGAGLTVKWFGLELYETGVELERVTMPLLTADRVAVLNGNKQLVSSGISVTKLDFLSLVSSDIQTQLNNKLDLSGNNANQNIVLGSYKVQSTATPTVNSDYTTKIYVDNEIIGAGSLYLLKTGGTMTGDIVMGANKITSTATPTTDDTLTRKGYVDTQDALKVNKAGDTMTATLFNSVGDFHPYKGGDPNRGCVLFANNDDGASLTNYNGGLASWFGIGFKSTNDSITRFVFNVRNGNSEQVGTHKANGFTVDGQTASRVCVLDANKNIVSSSVTSTTLTYLDIGSSLVGLLNLKANLVGPNTFSNTHTFTSPVPITLSGLTASRVLQLDGSGNVESSTVTTTTLGFLDATSSVQNQLNSKLNLTGGTLSGDLTVNGTTTSVGSRFLGTPDSSPAGNFWMGLRGTGTEIQRLAISINGNQTTGVVDFVSIPKTLNLSYVTAARVLVIDGSQNVQASTVSTTTLGFLDATSSVQNQLNGKLNDTGDTVTGTLGWSGTNVAEFGIGLTKEVNAGKIGYNWVAGAGLEIVGGGTTAGSRAVVVYEKLGVGQAPSAGRFQVGFNGGEDYATFNNTNYSVGEYINQRFLFGSLSGTNRSAYIQAVLLASNQTDLAFYVGGGTGVSERMRIKGDGNVNIAAQVNIGLASNSTPNIKFANSLNHISNSASEAWLFSGYNGHIAIGRNATRNATTANLMMGVESTEESQIISVKTDNSGYMPMSFASSRYAFVGGNVGVGTATPGYPLHIYKATAGASFSFQMGNTDANYMDIRTNGTAGRMFIGMDSSTGTGLFGGNSSYMGWVGMPNSASLGFATNNAERMRITQSGDVGIGTTAPNARLHTVDLMVANYSPFRFTDALVSASGASASLAIASGNEGTQATLYLGTPHVPTASTQSAYKCAIIANGQTNWSTADLHFCVNGATGSNDYTQSASLTHSRMMIKSSTGYVGIGTTTPNSRLDVAIGTARTGSHGSGLGLYVTKDGNAIAEFRDPNGSQGLGFGYNQIYTVGSNASQGISIIPRGVGNVNIELQSASAEFQVSNNNPVFMRLYNRDYATNNVNGITCDHGSTSYSTIWSYLLSSTTKHTRLRFSATQGVFSAPSTYTPVDNPIMYVSGQYRGVGINGKYEDNSLYDASNPAGLLCVGGSDPGGNGCIKAIAQPVGDYGGRAQDSISCRASNDGNYIIDFINTAGSGRGQIAGVNSSSVAYNTSSDKRLKDCIHPIEGALDIVTKLEAVHFRWKNDDEYDFGFIAQDVYKILPHMRPNFTNYIKECYCRREDICRGVVCEHCQEQDDEPVDENGNPKYYSLDYGKFTPYLVGAVQEQQKQIDVLTERNKVLETHARQQEKALADYKAQTDARMEKMASLLSQLISKQ